MNRVIWLALLLTVTIAAAHAQVPSHSSTLAKPASVTTMRVEDKPLVRINGAVLTDRDLLREMYTIFPYARQHGGTFPKTMAADIRRGALEMIVFEELVYQEAKRRNLPLPAARVDQAVAKLRAQLGPEDFRQYLQQECQGAVSVLRERIRRSMLIEALLKTEIQDKAMVTSAAARAYYDKNPAEFQRPEMFAIQTISIIPPQHATPQQQKEARQRAEEALRQAKRTPGYREFGLLAEKFSDDDWHVNMGDRKSVSAAALPPPLVQAARAMKVGQVSDLIQLGPNFTLFRLNAHTLAGKAPFDEAKATLQANLQKAKVNRLRSELNQKLHKNAKIETL